MKEINFNVTDVNVSYNEDDLIFHTKTLFLMNGLANKSIEHTNLDDVFKSINEKLSNDIKVSGVEENKTLVSDIKTIIALKLYLVTVYDFIVFSLKKDSIESEQILKIINKEYSNEWEGGRLSE